MWYSTDMFHYMFKAEFVTLVSLKVSSGSYSLCSDSFHHTLHRYSFVTLSVGQERISR